MDLAHVRGYNIKPLFQYDFVTSYLFEAEYLMARVARCQWPEKRSTILVDAVANMRRISTKSYENFGQPCEALIENAIAISHKASFWILLYSTKYNECLRRKETVTIH